MSKDNKQQLRETAQCIRVLLRADGIKASMRKISGLLENEDLDAEPTDLKEKVKVALNDENDMRAPASDGSSERRTRIETFMINNWSQIRDDNIVRAALLDAYCKGRIKKDRRQEMQEELVKRCEASVDSGSVPVQNVQNDSDDVEDPTFDF